LVFLNSGWIVWIFLGRLQTQNKPAYSCAGSNPKGLVT